MVILTAVAVEARAVAGAWGLKSPKPGKPVHFCQGEVEIEIHLIGIGAAHIPENLLNPPPAAIIMAGLAGALDPALGIGEVVVDDCPPTWLTNVLHRVGKIVCSPTLISTPEQKRKLRQKTNALAVDMESGPVRSLAIQCGALFVSVRAISDSADESLDPILLKLVDHFGRPRAGAIAMAILHSPLLIRSLIRFGANSTIAAANMAKSIVELVNNID